MKTEICENCGGEISEQKQAFVRNGHILCEKCYRKVEKDARPHRVSALILCTLGGLAIGFFAGRMLSKYESTSSFDHSFNRMLEAITPADMHAKSKRIISVSSVGFGDGTIFVELTNISDKNIKAALGDVLIFDQFGQLLKTLRVHRDEPILAGQTIKERWYFYLDEGRNQQIWRLFRSGHAKAQFVAQDVIYADGTREKFKPIKGLEKFKY